ncbi:MAG: tetratricopeptide repeat protein, partial [Thermodesulfobacteriota bacterium]
ASSADMPVVARLFIAAKAYVFYLYKTIWPSGLAPLYPLPQSVEVMSLAYLGSLVALIAITVLAVISFKKHKLFLLLWIYFLVTLLPVIGIVHVGAQAAADRYTYLPSLGIFLAVGISAGYFYSKFKGKGTGLIITAAAVIILAAFVVKTEAQIGVWKDSLSLWEHEVALYPDTSSRAYVNLGSAADAKGITNKAKSAYLSALKINPDSVEALNNLGSIYLDSANFIEAAKYYERALKLATGKRGYQRQINENLGDAYLRSGRLSGAARAYLRAIEVGPPTAGIYNKLGVTYATSGLLSEAKSIFKNALIINPNHEGAKENLEKLKQLNK